jgi:hypothetical protein
MAAFVVTFANGATASYNARNFTVADPGSTPQTYYVTIDDPTETGDGSPELAAYCDTTAARANTAGYIFAGKIIVTHAGYETGGPGGPAGITAPLTVTA